MEMNCLQCNNKNSITHWCLDIFCEKNLLCEQCSSRHEKSEKILNRIKIKSNIRNIQKKIQIQDRRILNYCQKLEREFNNPQKDSIEILKQQLQLYKQHIQSLPKVKSGILNLNNVLNGCYFPQAEDIFEENFQFIKQIIKCKQLIQEKYYIQAQYYLLFLQPKQSIYFQIECHILQKDFKQALQLSSKAIKEYCNEQPNLQPIELLNQQPNEQLNQQPNEQPNQQPNEQLNQLPNLQHNLLIQQAKIFYKQAKYDNALNLLNILKTQNLDEQCKNQFKLQIGKIYIKCGFLDLGLKEINTFWLANDRGSSLLELDQKQEKLENTFSNIQKEKKDSEMQLIDENKLIEQENKLIELGNKLIENEQRLIEEKKQIEQEKKQIEQEKKQIEQEKKQIEKKQFIKQENILIENEQRLIEEKKQIEQEKKKIEQEKKKIEQEKKLIDQENKLNEQEKKLTEEKQFIKQDKKLIEKQKKLIEEKKLIEQEKKLIEQEKKLIDQENKLIELGNKLIKEKKLIEQEKKLIELGNKLIELGNKLIKEKKLTEQEKQLIEEIILIEQDKKLIELGNKLIELGNKLIEEKKLIEQEKKLIEEIILIEQDKKVIEKEKKLIEEQKLNDFITNNKEKFYCINNFSFSLAVAKANFLKNNEIGISEDQQNQNQRPIILAIQTVEKIYEEILRQQPTNQKALYGLSQTYMKQKKYQEARDLLYQLYQLNPKYNKAEISLIFIKNKLLEKDSNFMIHSISNIEGCLGFMRRVYGCFRSTDQEPQQQM